MEQALALLLTYKYYILLPLSIVEGPIITIIAGFLASAHLINPFIVYAIVVFGDLVGDTVSYSLGRWGSGLLPRFGAFLGATPERIVIAEAYFAKNHGKAVAASKLVYGIGSAGLVAAGILRIPYMRYIRTCFAITIAQCAVFLATGFFFGSAYVTIGRYLDYYTAGISIAAVIALILFIFYRLRK